MEAVSPTARPETTTDRVLGDTLSITQPARGTRVSSATLILGSAAAERMPRHVVDLGAGVGTVGLVVAARCPSARITLFERLGPLCELAEENAAANGFDDRVCVVQGDVRACESALPAGQADLVVCNPPYYPAGSGRLSPDPFRAASHHELAGDLSDFIAAARNAVAPRGALLLMYPADRFLHLADVVRAGGFHLSAMCPVYTRPAGPASAVLLEAKPEKGAGFRVDPPIRDHAPHGGSPGSGS